MRQAVILAGGRGTRLRTRAGTTPKPLVELGGVPLLERQIRNLTANGFEDIVLLVSHAAERIAAFCAKTRFSASVRLIDDGVPRGTAGAVLAAIDELDPEFLVIYGDTLFCVDLTRFARFHASLPDAGATLFVHPNDHPADSDLIEMDESGRITAFRPYPHPQGAQYANVGSAALYFVRRSSVLSFRDLPAPLDFGKQLFPAMLRNGTVLRGYLSTEYVKDVGTPERLDEAEAALRAGRVERACLKHPQRAVFIDRDGTLNVHKDYVSSPDRLEVYEFVAPALRRLNRSEWKAIVVTNQPVLARGECTAAELRQIHAKLDSVVALGRAYIDRYYVCPHHPDRGFEGEVRELKCECDCRKPAPGLLLRARDELNISLRDSWVIGDSAADIGAAARAGATSILVRTGVAGRDEKGSECVPDFVEDDFARAVDFILEAYPRLQRQCCGVVARLAPGGTWYVGGLSQSGKTTVAATLRREARLLGLQCEVISLDRWLRDRPDRGAEVCSRYHMAEIVSAMQSALCRSRSNVTLLLPVYDRLRRQRQQRTTRLDLTAGTVLIVEGIVALDVARQLGADEFTIHVQSGEAERRERIVRKYRGQGNSAEAAEAVYRERLCEEDETISAGCARAAYRIDTAAASRPTRANRDAQ